MTRSVWLMEDKCGSVWRINQPYRLYKSEESARKGLERHKREYGTHIQWRVTEYRAVDGDGQ